MFLSPPLSTESTWTPPPERVSRGFRKVAAKTACSFHAPGRFTPTNTPPLQKATAQTIPRS